MIEKYQKLLEALKRKDRCNLIHQWHEETLTKMKLNLLDLRKVR